MWDIIFLAFLLVTIMSSGLVMSLIFLKLILCTFICKISANGSQLCSKGTFSLLIEILVPFPQNRLEAVRYPLFCSLNCYTSKKRKKNKVHYCSIISKILNLIVTLPPETLLLIISEKNVMLLKKKEKKLENYRPKEIFSYCLKHSVF